MAQEDTVRQLADMTDEGAFERLATAILRQSDDRFRSLSYPGVNADGKTSNRHGARRAAAASIEIALVGARGNVFEVKPAA